MERYERLRVIQDELRDPAHGVALDEAISVSVATGKMSPTVRLWRNETTLVVGRFDPKRPGFGRGVAYARELGLTVVQRISGGGAVLHEPGCLNFSVSIPEPEAFMGVREAFVSLCDGVIRGLETLGISCGFGRVPEAFCDGSHNLIVNGKKIAGTAQARRRGFILVHGTLFVDGNLDRMTRIINGFYRSIDEEQAETHADAVTTLSRELGRPVSLEEVAAALAEGYRAMGTIESGTVLKGELEMAKLLKDEVLV
ncbi:MAG: biotin/lipoate A/B protein ligase family protein [Candidatus Bipolaricaulia bacterium]